MANTRPLLTFKGRSLGIIGLTAAQLFIGIIHIFFGMTLTFATVQLPENFVAQQSFIYDIYTVVFGVLISVFAVLLWLEKWSGWVGTVAVSLFVITADSLAVLNLPSMPGIPKFAAVLEIPYSVLIVF
jgi:hypothetical protein